MKHKTWGEVLHDRSSSSLARNGSVGGPGNLDDDDQDDMEKEEERRREEEKDRHYNFIHTAFVCFASFACGMVTSQRGPSIQTLGRLVRADIQRSASFFALGAGGQLAGSLVAGVAYGRFRAPLVLFWALLGMGGTTAALPLCGGYGLMAAVYFFSFFFVGCVETGSYVDVAKRWSTKGSHIVQLLQLSFVVGGVISPALTQLFLTSKHYSLTATTNNGGGVFPERNASTTPALIAFTTAAVWRSTPSNTPAPYVQTVPGVQTTASEQWSANATASTEDSRVVYAYAINAVVSFVAAFLFAVGHFLRKQKEIFARVAQTPKPRHSERTVKALPALAALGVFFFALSGVEESFHQFLAPFLVEDQHWSPATSALLTSWFWCGVLLVRLASLCAPSFVGGEEQGLTLALSSSFLPASLVALHLFSVLSIRDGMWACVFFVGMSSSLIFQASFTWIHSAFPVVSPGALSAVIMLSVALAGMINPLVLGGFFQRGIAGSKNGKGGFCFLLLFEACLLFVAYVTLRVLAAKTRSSSGSANANGIKGREEDEDIVMEIEVPPGRFGDVHEPVDIEQCDK